jgi:solute:Na+ symporter, SSS family
MEHALQNSHFQGGFVGMDWAVLGGYFAVLALTGLWFARREQRDAADYFLGGRKMPVWAVAISIVATSLSAATFIGAPELSFGGNLTYLATNIGMVLAALIIAFYFIPRFYQTQSASIYEFLERRIGIRTRKSASIAFLIGRVLASGARVFAAAIPLSMVIFGIERGLEPDALIMSIGALSIVAIAYTLWGGISSVIWSDVLQYIVLIGAAIAAIVLIGQTINAPMSEVLNTLRNPIDENGIALGSKLTTLDWSFDLTHPFAIPACLIGYTLLGIGSYGTDQDLAQRMLTCKDSKAGARSVIMGIILGVPTVAIFLTVGLMLWIAYQHPELTSEPITRTSDDGNNLRVFLEYILTQVPPGFRGLMMAGLFAAGLSSMNSAINAMGAAFIADLYRPLVLNRDEKHYVKLGRYSVIVAGIVLGVFACVCIYWKDANGYTLIDFALSVMGFAYAGLVGVYFTAIFTKRGNDMSAIAALIIGFLWMLGSQPFLLTALTDPDQPESFLNTYASIHHTWKLTLGVLISTGVCMLGKSHTKSQHD